MRGLLIVEEVLRRAFDHDPEFVLREESFGGLAYHFGTRRLVFLKSRELAEVVRSLPDAVDLGGALRAVGVPERRWPGYEQAVLELVDSGLLKARGAVRA